MQTELCDGKMLSFYKKHKVAPVYQNIPDMLAHFHRRETLYKQLGLSPSSFKDKRLLEIGPGTGQNALFFASQKPQILTLVEPNPTGISKIQETFDPYPDYQEFVEVKNIRIEDFESSQKYDFVFCEGLIGNGGLSSPEKLISSIVKHADPLGKIVLTCQDYQGYLSEMLRRLLGLELTRGIKNFNERVSLLTNVFGSHLKHLRSMTRESSNWVIDNLISLSAIANLVTFYDLVHYLLPLGFEVKGTSPRFIADWTWYKSAAGEKDFFNQSALRSYWANAHSFMDYRSVFAPRDSNINQQLVQLCQCLHKGIRNYEETGNNTYRKAVVDNLEALIILAGSDMSGMVSAIQEVCSWLKQPAINASIIKESREFGSWFGQAQTYVLFEKSK